MSLSKHRDLFLRQSYMDTQEEYIKTLSNRDAVVWDYVVITASNESQAQAYTQQINYRVDHHMLPESTHYVVLPDPDGKRVGSGGATLNVLKYIHDHSNTMDCFKDKKILVIHSGD
ncbi:MAG: hypothetical protein ACYCYM_10905 [Saccharofermentanales bacterium]